MQESGGDQPQNVWGKNHGMQRRENLAPSRKLIRFIQEFFFLFQRLSKGAIVDLVLIVLFLILLLLANYSLIPFIGFFLLL